MIFHIRGQFGPAALVDGQRIGRNRALSHGRVKFGNFAELEPEIGSGEDDDAVIDAGLQGVIDLV